MRLVAFIVLLVIVSAPTTLYAADTTKLPAAADSEIDFVQNVQPILRKTCYSCHGAEEQEAGLRLDIRSRAFEGGDGGKVILPGKSAESRIVMMVAGLDEDAGIMPPEGEGTPLTPEQISILRAWIDQGAKWPDGVDDASQSSHWSFQPITRPRLPSVGDAAWMVNAIDAYILARLEKAKIAPSPEAPRSTLIRRVYLDLIGLPPTPEELNAFLSDESPDAYERMVERVFASPHYGERRGRQWLDLARYADSDGYEKDRARPHAWRYRNWVIDAINADIPYDQFSIQQLAGDLLADVATEQRVATGFHRNTLHNTEGGTDQEEDRVKKTVDRTNTVGTIWLGLTVGCAQCHRHKYDPLTQREYYQLYAFFNSIDEADIDAPLPADQERFLLAKQAFDAEHGKLQDVVTAYEKAKLAAAQQVWEKTALDTSVVWRDVEYKSAISKHGATLETQKDRSLLAKKTNTVADIYTIATTVMQPVTAVRLEVLPDDSLTKKGPGRANNGNFVLTTFRLQATSATGQDAPKEIALAAAKADFSQKDWDVAKAINEDSADGWAVNPEIGKRHVAVFELKEPVHFDGGTKLTFILDQNYEGETHNIGRFRLSFTSGKLPATLEGLPAIVGDALAVAADKRTAEQAKQVTDYFRTVDPELAKLNKIVSDHAKKAPKTSGVKAQTVSQRAEVRQTNIHIRGDFLAKGDSVSPRTPTVFHDLAPRSEQADRLDFAKWLFAEDNPLMARVTVNRIWQRFFGRGIVETVDDFGTQGELPSHPELLDWLATEFRQQDWSVKRIQRLIVTSRTYRQSAAYRPDLAEADPQNVLLARQQRRRVEAELIRDLSLAASGLLDTRLGGPSVRPPQPAEYSALTYANSAKWQVSKGGDAYRRGLYTFFQRTSPYPMLITFDSPDSTECCTQRTLSNTPLQALTLWNDPAFFECAQSFGWRVLNSVPLSADAEQTVADQGRYAFELSLARRPSEEELAAVVELYRAQLDWAEANEEAVAKIVGKQKPSAGASLEQLAAWIVVGRALLNLDEFITRE
ncbi:MAG: hypothetical protein CMJ64_08495 [Planctomycetaceae bacterium]|nr:hypothetical protein [Planctomycetaceae bacterium]